MTVPFIPKPAVADTQAHTRETLHDLRSLEQRLTDGVFYKDYDEDWRLVGVLRDHIVARSIANVEGQIAASVAFAEADTVRRDLLAENERLREALREIAAGESIGLDAEDIALAALSEQEGK